jgi:hypothetical protein
MPGQSPLNMMRAEPRPLRRRPAPARRKRRLWPFVVPLIVAIVALGWTWLWNYAAGIAREAEAAWIQREAALGRVYACGALTIGGFPFSIVSRCAQAAASFRNTQPPFDARANGVTFSADVFRPTVLSGEVSGPITLADPGQAPAFVANFSVAKLRLFGLPPEPEAITVTLRQPRLDRISGSDSGPNFQAEAVDVDGRIISGSATSNPVIEATAHLTGAMAPKFHALLTEPLTGDIDAVLRGFKDFSPKPWAALFRDMQAAGGGIQIKTLRIERPDAIIVGNGTLTVNQSGKVDGLIQVAVVGLDNIVPLLGIDQLIGQGIDRLTGGSGSANQGLSMLDRLVPGLGGVVRENATSSVIDNIKRMGQPTEVDHKPAVALPLRVTDGVIFLGLIPLWVIPPLF